MWSKNQKMCVEIPCPRVSVITTQSQSCDSELQEILNPWASSLRSRDVKRVLGFCTKGKCTMAEAGFSGRYQERSCRVRSRRSDGFR